MATRQTPHETDAGPEAHVLLSETYANTSAASALTPTQRAVLFARLAYGSTVAAAEVLRIRPATAKKHLENINLRLHCHSAAEALYLVTEGRLGRKRPCP